MTLGRDVEALGMREVRERIRAVVARTAARVGRSSPRTAAPICAVPRTSSG